MTVDLQKIIERFRTINKERLDRAYSVVRPAQRDFLRLIPLFFHLNHPTLPGYVSRDTPIGIKAYEPEKETLFDVQKYSKSINYRKPPNRAINAIYAMGSIGTISHNAESDFDLWLCHDPALTPLQIEKLQEKAQAIELAAEQLKLEVHFFLINAETFRSGEQLELSSESSGTAQHHLLLDEFYRTAVLLEGQFPAWWIVPPEEDHRYSEYMEEIERKRFFFLRDMINFGGVHAIPPEEFFGAAVWQFAKAIDSPYKSLIKLLLIESYMSEHPRMHLLSQQFKEAVYSGVTDIDLLDPYRMLIERLEKYLTEMDERAQLELLYRGFYFKINLPLSALPSRTFAWKREMLTKMTTRWGWSKIDLILLDDRSNWQVPQVINERKLLFDALASSYRALSHFAREIGAESMISDVDLTILGRKLFAAYERKAGKVELIRRGIDIDLLEQRISIHQTRGADGRYIWHLYADYVEKINEREVPIKRARSLVELLAWAYFNEVVNRNSAVALFSQNRVVDDIVVRRIIAQLCNQFPLGAKMKSGVDSFSHRKRLEQSQFLVNTGIDHAESIDINRYELERHRIDSLSYGSNKECQLKHLDWVHTTNWGEVFCNHYFGERGLAEAISNYFKWYSTDDSSTPEIPDFMSMGITKGTSITRRLTELFGDLIACSSPMSRYVLAIGKHFFVFAYDGELLSYQEFKSIQGLLGLLKKVSAQFGTTVIDRHTLIDSPLPVIYAKNREGIIQLFFCVRGRKVDIYIVDEHGALFHQRSTFYDQKALINQYSHFFESIINRINFQASDGGNQSRPKGLEFYLVTEDKEGLFNLKRQSPDFFNHGSKFFSLQVIVDSDEESQTIFTIYCEEIEFSPLKYGDRLFEEVAKYVLTQRSSGESYPIYITDISMSTDLLSKGGGEQIQSVQFLEYKQRIEERLNKALEKFSKG